MLPELLFWLHFLAQTCSETIAQSRGFQAVFIEYCIENNSINDVFKNICYTFAKIRILWNLKKYSLKSKVEKQSL